MFEQLEEKRWIKMVDHDQDGRTALYGTTLEFLEYFGLNDIQDLPELPDLEDLTLNLNQLKYELS